MGVAPLVWTEIISWANQFYYEDIVQWVGEHPVVQRRCVLEDYELEIIMQLSREYCAEYGEATDPQRPCPREIFLDEVDAEANADAILEGFKQLFNVQVDTKPEIIRN